jgi:hypothetical protein
MDRCSVASTGIMRDPIQRRAAEPSVRGLATVSVARFWRDGVLAEAGSVVFSPRRHVCSPLVIELRRPDWTFCSWLR